MAAWRRRWAQRSASRSCTTATRHSSLRVPSWTMRCREPRTCRRCASRPGKYRPRSTRWVPRAWARRARSAVLRRRSTRSATRSDLWASTTSTCPRRLSGSGRRSPRAEGRADLLLRLQVIRQEAGVDDLGPVDVAADRAHELLGLDHAVHALDVEIAGTPIGLAGLGARRGQVPHRALRHLGLEVVRLRDDRPGLVRVRVHVVDRLPARPQDRAEEIAAALGRLPRGYADDVVERWQDLAGGGERAVLRLVLRPQR